MGRTTAIMLAAIRGNTNCLKFLVDSGGDINVRDNVSPVLVMILSVTPLSTISYDKIASLFTTILLFYIWE